MIYPHNFEQKIGFDQIRQLLKGKCLSTLGEERVDEMTFSDNYDEMFMEPVIVPNNVEEGYGFVGASSACTDTMRVFYAPPSW